MEFTLGDVRGAHVKPGVTWEGSDKQLFGCFLEVPSLIDTYFGMPGFHVKHLAWCQNTPV